MNRIYIVGMGPGKEEMMTGEALQALEQADTIVGYTTYLNLLGERFREKKLYATPMRREAERCRFCFEEAEKGRIVALICSGDAGIYGMASLMFEIGKEHPQTELLVVAGVTAANSGAAVLGAPLGHDFCTISLSDLLTPWETIEKRLRTAAAGNFVIVLYNPSSHKRKDYLRRACSILSDSMEESRVCGYVENIGRDETRAEICTLGELRDREVNMFTTVFIGSTDSEVIDGRFVTKRGYRSEERVFHKIALFAGTTEGRRLSEILAAAGIAHTVCVATEYGELVLQPHPSVHIRRGRMNREKIADFVREGQFTLVIDATHPYAREITANIKAAVAEQNGAERTVSYLRLRRDGAKRPESGVTYFETDEDCAKALENTEGNILLTTGSKELSRYCRNSGVKSRLYVRVLPGMESLALCLEQGICGKQIIAVQGPFTAQLNEAIIRQYQISCLVTKESGAAGGYPEKVKAAEKTGAKIFVIGRPGEEEGCSFAEICGKLEKLCGIELPKTDGLELTLAGIGMGSETGLTREVERAIEEADVLLGAERMLAAFPRKQERYSFYQAEQIVPYLREIQETDRFTGKRKIAILFSGDSGFYSGCQSLHEALEKEIREGRLKASVRILPGISSVAYLAARTGESYHDAAVYSIHGKEAGNLADRLRSQPKTFLLTSGVRDVNQIGRLLTEAGMRKCEVITGRQLSYAGEQIRHLTPQECMEVKEEGLYTCLVKNPCPEKRRLTPGIADGEFIRERTSTGNIPGGIIPMTKEEVREVSICKLRLREGAVVYDIGSGTGSIAVEIAGLSDDIQVYAVERRKEAVSLIEKNRDRFGLQNIRVVEAEAPEGLSALPVPTQAFIGGSGGRLQEILSVLQRKNPHMRIVINAVSLETVCEIKELLSLYQIKNEEILQLQVSRAGKAGSHHLMRAENPVWICAFDFDGQ